MNEDRKALLRQLWDQGIPVKRIMSELGFAQRTSVRHAAQKLGLPPREPNRTTTKATEANRQRLAERRRLQALAEHDPVMPEPVEREELPCCFVCGGRAKDWDGHPQCRGRAA